MFARTGLANVQNSFPRARFWLRDDPEKMHRKVLILSERAIGLLNGSSKVSPLRIPIGIDISPDDGPKPRSFLHRIGRLPLETVRGDLGCECTECLSNRPDGEVRCFRFKHRLVRVPPIRTGKPCLQNTRDGIAAPPREVGLDDSTLALRSRDLIIFRVPVRKNVVQCFTQRPVQVFQQIEDLVEFLVCRESWLLALRSLSLWTGSVNRKRRSVFPLL